MRLPLLSLSDIQTMNPPPLQHASSLNPKLLRKCVKSISTHFIQGKVQILKPTGVLQKLKTKIPASDLKIGTHFKELALDSVFHEGDSANSLAMSITDYLVELQDHCKVGVIPAITKCEADVLENLSILKNGIRNEMELRFAVADPILRLLCSYWRLQECGEVGGILLLLQGA